MGQQEHERHGNGTPHCACQHRPMLCMPDLFGSIECQVLFAGHQLRELVVCGLLLARTKRRLVHVVAVQRRGHKRYGGVMFSVIKCSGGTGRALCAGGR